MRVCHILQYYTVVILLLSYADFLGAKALTDGEYQGQSKEQRVPISKRAAGVAAEEDDQRFIKSHQKYKRRRSPFGIVYKDGKPIGILEPISRIYEYQNFQDDLNNKNTLNKRDNIDAPSTGEDTYVKRDIDRLESDNVLRSFRMNPHFQDQPVLDASNLDRKEQKRDAKKSEISKVDDNEGSKLSVIENNLKEIISDLNTISTDDEDESADSLDKRETQMEDEDLDNGVNKIGLTKETHAKRFEAKGLSSETSIKEKKSADVHAPENNMTGEKKIADYRNEGESFIRQKRQQTNGNKQDVNDIIKGLEASGDLTVSGNKSPLASASSTVEAESKKAKGGDFEKREKQADDDLDYEKRLQRNIQNKITEIKEQVKREIQALKITKESSPDDKQSLNEETRKLKEVVDDKSSNLNLNEPEQKSTRQKRNLLEQDTSEIDLAQSNEPGTLTSHLRQKRALEYNNEDIKNVKNKRTARQTVVVKKIKRDNNAVRHDSLGFGPGQAQKPNSDAAIATVKEPPEARRAIAIRNTKLTAGAVGGLDAEKLEKLVKESATLTESIKSERGARFQQQETAPHIEVELLGPPKDSKKIASLNQDDDESAAIADLPDMIANTNKDAVVLKRETRVKQNSEKKDKSFQDAEEKRVNTKIEEIEAVSDSSPAPAQGGNDHQYKAYEASTKLTPKAEDTPDLAEIKTGEMQTDNPGDNKLHEEDAVENLNKLKPEKRADEEDSEDGDLTKLAISNQVNRVRQERKSEPMLSLEDMQALDSENNMKRRRRYVDEYDDYSPREKRDYDVQNMHFRNYRGDEDEADDESDEFDDDNFDDRTANLVRKRATQQELENYDDLDDDYEPRQEDAVARMNKRNVNARDYVARMNEDAYDNTNYLYDANGRPLNRNKRQILDKAGAANMAALHSGGPMTRHLAAIRGRQVHLEDKSKRLEKNLKNVNAGNAKSNQMISGLSESDIFGALPQSYEGELTRFKRVKRDDPAG